MDGGGKSTFPPPVYHRPPAAAIAGLWTSHVYWDLHLWRETQRQFTRVVMMVHWELLASQPDYPKDGEGCWCTLCNGECFVVIAPVDED